MKTPTERYDDFTNHKKDNLNGWHNLHTQMAYDGLRGANESKEDAMRSLPESHWLPRKSKPKEKEIDFEKQAEDALDRMGRGK